MLRRCLALSVLALVALVASAAPAAADRYVEGAPGAGDPFFPFAGNGGYDVRHYTVTVDYDPDSKVLSGRTIVFARTTQNLKSFNLDLRPFLEVSDVTVNFRRASFTREGEHELVIRPQRKLKKHRPLVVSVRYEGVAEPIVDPDQSIEGWIPTPDGAFVVNEPQGSPGWYAVNDTPIDKATYNFAITVPEGRTAVANGRLTGSFTRAGKTTWLWRESDPMAPYLSTATNGTFLTDFDDTLADGTPIYNAVDPLTRRADLHGASARPRLRAPGGSARSDRLLRGPLRRVSLRGRGRDHGLGARRWATPWRARRRPTTARSPRPPRSSTRSPTSGSATR